MPLRQFPPLPSPSLSISATALSSSGALPTSASESSIESDQEATEDGGLRESEDEADSDELDDNTDEDWSNEDA
ncbi:hypothetical protein F442_09315 [Phytophthora nicotianae P10297]|uniref:Uncharacterized protein n=3 Tax=Phytophthora nicotianae TaxID=4792 RepID=W2Z9V3_PHYNI|nr:hypothetical protein F442_09315 [Phytophthora nicotianae P10297]